MEDSSNVALPVNRAAEMEDNSNVILPVIDLGGLRSGDPSQRARIAREIREATEEWGLFQIVNHSVTNELQVKTHEQARQFFDLPLDVKNRAELDSPNLRVFGYHEMLVQNGAGLPLKQSLANSRSPSQSVDLATKIWPGGDQTFCNTVEEYCLSVEALGYELLELLAESVGLQRDFYSRHFKNPAELYGTWRLHHFPPNILPFQPYLIPHTDPSNLTLLKQDVSGLQVKKPGGSVWLNFQPLPGGYVVIVGNLLEAWSNGRFPSGEHRVGLNEEHERYSMVVFLDAHPSWHIEAPPPELIDDEHPSQFVPFTASDFRENFNIVKKVGDITRGKALKHFRRSTPVL